MKSIDAHVHMGNFPFGRFTERLNVFDRPKLHHKLFHDIIMKGASGHVLDIKRFLERNDLDGCVLVPLSKRDEDSMRGVKIKNVFRLRFFSYGTRMCKLDGFDGYKIHPVIENMDINSHNYGEFFASAEKKKVPLLVHAGFYPLKRHAQLGAVKKLRALMDAYNLRIMVCHGGGEYWSELMRMSHNYDFSVDLSLCSPRVIESFYGSMNANRLVFGSDYPIGNPVLRRELINGIVGRKDAKKILYGNALRFFG